MNDRIDNLGPTPASRAREGNDGGFVDRVLSQKLHGDSPDICRSDPMKPPAWIRITAARDQLIDYLDKVIVSLDGHDEQALHGRDVVDEHIKRASIAPSVHLALTE